MIKVNLLTVERKGAKKKIGGFQLGQKLIAVCSLILVAAVLFIGWRYWTLDKESQRLDADITRAQGEVARLQSIIAEVTQFEQRSQELQQRVSLIEQLRRDQTGPVHILDQVSRALPPMLWLLNMKQGANPNEVLIEGRCTTVTGLTDFVTNLEQSGFFRRSVEILESKTEPLTTPPGELIHFSIRAQFQQAGAVAGEKPVATTAAPGAKPAGAN
jgi:type IV pilus assembly protein PilN